MDINKYLQNLKINWEDGIKKDEWYFNKSCKLLEDSIDSREAFMVIPDVLLFMEHEKDIDFFVQVVDILLMLIRKSDTTELPKNLLKLLPCLKEKVKNYECGNISFDEIEDWYRI